MMAKNAKSWAVFEREVRVSKPQFTPHLVDLNEIYKMLEELVLETTRTPSKTTRKFTLFHFSLKLKSSSKLGLHPHFNLRPESDLY